MLSLKRTGLFLTALFLFYIQHDFKFRRRLAQYIISTSLGQTVIFYLTRFLLGYAIPPILTNWIYVWPTNPAQDGLPYFDHVKYVRRTRYGPHPREELDELLPVEGQEFAHPNRTPVAMPSGVLHMAYILAKESFKFASRAFDHHPHAVPTTLGKVKDDAPAVLFGHGGGWVCQGTDVQLGQLPALVRGSHMAVFTFNYALAPEDPFPCAVLSTLRAMSYLKTHRGYDSVALVGESAGGNLVTMAAMFVRNAKLMKKLAQASETDCDTWIYPEVSCVVSWYSILDDQSWRNPDLDHAWLQSGLGVVWDMYLGKNPKLEGKCTCVQWKAEIEDFPPTFSLAGSYDPLGLFESTVVFHTMLSQELGIPSCEFKAYNATHGFVGYPSSFQQALSSGDDSHWKENCWQATVDTVSFLRRHHGHNTRTRVLGG